MTFWSSNEFSSAETISRLHCARVPIPCSASNISFVPHTCDDFQPLIQSRFQVEYRSTHESETCASELQKFAGVEMNILCLIKFVGTAIGEWATQFEALIRGQIVNTATDAELHPTLRDDLIVGSHPYDVILLTSNWMPEFINSVHQSVIKRLTNNAAFAKALDVHNASIGDGPQLSDRKSLE